MGRSGSVCTYSGSKCVWVARSGLQWLGVYLFWLIVCGSGSEWLKVARSGSSWIHSGLEWEGVGGSGTGCVGAVLSNTQS